MASRSLPKRVAAVAAAFGVTAIVGTAPAFATTVPGENIFGSGSSLQKIAQLDVWTGTWHSTAADHPTLSNAPTATYFSSSSGHGLDEWGNNTSSLDLTQDANADNGSTNGYGTPVLDAWVGTDDPPTGPVTTAGTQLANASQAASGDAGTKIDEITVPVAQAPVAVIMSLPTGITVGANTRFNFTNNVLRQVWDNNVVKSGSYAAKTWGALLQDLKLTRITSGTPGVNQFKDAGGTTGGTQAITLQVRSSGSGTSYTFKGFLHLSGDANYPKSFVVDDPTWPVPVTSTGNSGGSQLVADTTATPGSIGYANLADAATATPGYTSAVQTTTTGGSHQIAYARIQSNEGATVPVYADPEAAAAGVPNVYTGNNINVNNATPSAVGHWTVPLTGTTFHPTGTWGGTLADDPDVYDHSISNGVKSNDYPIVAATYDLGWSWYNEPGTVIASDFGGTEADATAAGQSAYSYLRYVVGAGQRDLQVADLYYAKLPQRIVTYAQTAAATIRP